MTYRMNVGIESFTEIGDHLKLIQLKEHANINRLCYSKVQGLTHLTADCWCRKTGEGGRDQPCPTMNGDYC